MLNLVVVLTFLSHTCTSYQWDYFTFSQTWPPGTCAEAVREHHKCIIPKAVQTWTIHGLWPSIYDSREPHDCNKSWHFDIDQVATIRADLDTYWPNLFDDTEVDSFWSHEWSKHGTCCTDLNATKDELQYFTKGLVLNRQLDISKILADSGIVPSLTATYSFDDFMAAINKSTGYNPVLQCDVAKMNGSEIHLIGQIEICLTKDFKPRTCYSKDAQPDKSDSYKSTDMARKVEKSDTLFYQRRKHRSGPQSDCPRHYDFYYPPMHYQYPAFG